MGVAFGEFFPNLVNGVGIMPPTLSDEFTVRQIFQVEQWRHIPIQNIGGAVKENSL